MIARRKRDWLELLLLLIVVAACVYFTAQAHSDSSRLASTRTQLASTERAITAATHALKAEHRDLGSEHTQLVDACERLQILRVQDNASHYADWRVFRVVLIESRVFAATTVETSAQRTFDKLFLPQLASAVHAKTWVPRTDCKVAVARFGLHYRPPAPIRFDVRLPPRSALTIPPGYFKHG